MKNKIKDFAMVNKQYSLTLIAVIISIIVWLTRETLLYQYIPEAIRNAHIVVTVLDVLLCVVLLTGCGYLTKILHCPPYLKRRFAKAVNREALKAKGTNEYPFLIATRTDMNKKHGKILIVKNVGRTPDDFDKELGHLERTLEGKIYCIEDDTKTTKTLIYFLPNRHIKPTIITPNDDAIGEISIRDLINGLVVGATGTGKTVLMKILLAKLTKFRNGKFWILDYKQMDFNFLSDCPRYFPDTDGCVQGFNDYYEAFDKQRKLRKPSPVPCYLIIDEWGSLIKALDNRTGDLLIKKLNVLLSAGRGVGYIPIIGLQRADAEYFGKARDNFFCRIGLGNLSSQGKKMIADDLKVFHNKRLKKREGYLVAEGIEIQKIEVDTIENLGALDNEIRKALLDGADGEAEAKAAPH